MQHFEPRVHHISMSTHYGASSVYCCMQKQNAATESVYYIYHSTYATIQIMQNTIVKYFCAKLLMYSVQLV